MIVQINMQSNYDVFTTDEITTYEGFNEQICKLLSLNPMKISDMLRRDFGIEWCNSFPDIPEREGYEYVSYKEYCEELVNSSSYTHLFFFGRLDDETDLKSIGKIYLPKGTMLGLFNPWQGGGSLCEMELIRSMEIDLTKPHGECKEYDTFSLEDASDPMYGYTFNDVYGMSETDEFWDNKFKFNLKEGY